MRSVGRAPWAAIVVVFFLALPAGSLSPNIIPAPFDLGLIAYYLVSWALMFAASASYLACLSRIRREQNVPHGFLVSIKNFVLLVVIAFSLPILSITFWKISDTVLYGAIY
jgi:hypothetical protein